MIDIYQIETETDENNHTTTYKYDIARDMVAGAKLLKKIDPENKIWSYTYDKLGNLATQTDAKGYVTTYNYDNQSRLSSQVDGRGHEYFHRYDGVGNRIQTHDYVRDDDNYISSSNITDELGEDSRNIIIDGFDKRILESWEYDSLNRLIKRTDALGRITRYEYDYSNNLTLKTDTTTGLIIKYE